MDARECALLAGAAAADGLAVDVVILDLRAVTLVSDYFVVCSGRNAAQVRAIADHVRKAVKEVDGRRPNNVEGYNGARWILLDYGDVVVHVFHEQEREYYAIERLWGDAKLLEVDATWSIPYN